MHMTPQYLIALLAIVVLLVVAIFSVRGTLSQGPAPAASASEVVELKNGDTYSLTAGFVGLAENVGSASGNPCSLSSSKTK